MRLGRRPIVLVSIAATPALVGVVVSGAWLARLLTFCSLVHRGDCGHVAARRLVPAGVGGDALHCVHGGVCGSCEVFAAPFP